MYGNNDMGIVGVQTAIKENNHIKGYSIHSPLMSCQTFYASPPG